MIEQIVRWAARSLAVILEKFGDPQLQAKLDSFNARVAEAEALEKKADELSRQSAIAYAASEAYRRELEGQLAQSRHQEDLLEEELKESGVRRAQIQHEIAAAKDAIDRMSDHDAIRGDV